jgi:alkylhydroperoxidase/carboxymuconolactone decarboxylase family protein YurZ
MSERSKRLLEEMMKKRGYIYPSYRVLAEDDPEFLETYDKLYELAMLKTMIFPEKIKELFFIAAIAARNPGDSSAMKNHMRRALEKGARRDEILEALKCAFFPGGALSLLYSINTLIEVIRERDAAAGRA